MARAVKLGRQSEPILLLTWVAPVALQVSNVYRYSHLDHRTYRNRDSRGNGGPEIDGQAYDEPDLALRSYSRVSFRSQSRI